LRQEVGVRLAHSEQLSHELNTLRKSTDTERAHMVQQLDAVRALLASKDDRISALENVQV
jgi:hypothetical protein